MNSLVSYESDGDYDSTEDKNDNQPSGANSRNYRKQPSQDANYEEVGMDLSEDSDDAKQEKSSSSSSRQRSSPDRRNSPASSRDDYRSKKEERSDSRSRDRYSRDDRRDRDKYKDSRDSRNNRDSRDSRDDKSSRYDRDRDRDDKHKSGDRNGRDYDRDRYRDSYRKRSRSRDRDRRRSRSRSRDRSNRSYSKRYDRASNKMDRLDKMGIEIKTPDCQYVKPSDLQRSMGEEKQQQLENNKSGTGDRFFMPGITGRFREQIERRKMLWQKKTEPEIKPEITATKTSMPQPLGGGGGSRATKVWETTTFAQDTDGKVASKFKRLMGIRNPSDGSGTTTDVLKKQEEMFSSMEQQYEVARTATHTMRGVGLGFGSFQK